MPDIQQIAESYVAVWNEVDPADRRERIRRLFTDTAGYTDPLAAVSGHDQIDQFVAGLQEQFVGLTFSLAGQVDAHHDVVRFTWHLNAPGSSEPVVIGFDVIEVEDGKVDRVTGFLDKAPA